jgi:regulatory protein YycI of two-component signal transduction system YycFG
MIWVLVFIIIICILIYIFYRIGLEVQRKSDILKSMMVEQNVKRELIKYKRKSTPKVPTDSKIEKIKER